MPGEGVNRHVNEHLLEGETELDRREEREQVKSIAIAIAPIFGFLGKVRTNTWYSILLLGSVICYLTMGAFVFKELETGEKFKNITEYKVYRREFLKWFMSEPGNGYNGVLFTGEDWTTLKSISVGRCFKADAAAARPHMWNFWSSMDFASTILTTIGYGGMAPRTTAGRMFTIVYAIPGMAIMMAYLGQFSMVIVIVLHKVINLVEKIVRIVLEKKDARLSQFVNSMIVFSVSLLMLLIYLTIMSWRMTAANSENDPLLKSFYFYVITMTTVGMGDIAMVDYVWWGVLAKVMFIFCLGLALVTTVFGASRGFFEENRKRIVKATRQIAERAKGMELFERKPKEEQLIVHVQEDDETADSPCIGPGR